MAPIKKKKDIPREFKGGAWDLREGDRRKQKPKSKPVVKAKTKSKTKIEPERRKGSRRRGFGGVF